MLVLGIESSCDETACAIVRDGRTILSNVVSSQIDLHREYGGVVPELACRRHIDLMITVLNQALTDAQLTLPEIDLIAVAHGPGLVGALLIGLNTAKALSLAHDKPFIGINHVEAHLYAALMSQTEAVQFPCLGAVLSGGHTSLVLIKELGVYEQISQTADDAVGEAYDKVARMLGLSYPGGPLIEKMALEGDPNRFSFKAGLVKGKPLDFSFSGLKTAVLYKTKELSLTDQDKRDIAAAFQEAALGDIIKKTLAAASQYKVQSILFGGGVTNNQALRQKFREASTEYSYIWPSQGLSLDNAAMIAGLGYHSFLKRGKGDSMELEPLTRIPFTAPNKILEH